MKTVNQIAKENNISAVTLYRRIVAKKMTPIFEKGIMMLNPQEEKDILVYSKRGRKNAQQDPEQGTIR